jgi:small-conductance mechanosensitive channel
MDYITSYTEQLLALTGADSTYVFLGNSLGAYALALVIFLLGLAVFAILQYTLLSWFARLSEHTKTDLDDTIVKMVRSFRPPFYLFLSFWLATRSLDIIGTADAIVTAILVVWLVYQAVVVVGILVEDVVFRHLAKEQDETTKSALHLLANIARGVMWLFGILLILSNFGINVTSLLAGAGIAGIAIAFALQGILSDLFSSFSIYFDKPFKVGDFIVTGDTVGTVKHVGVKSTRIKALSGEEEVLSNQSLTSARIQNYGQMKERRVVFPFGILYETPAEQVRAVPEMVKKIVESQENVRFDRAHFKKFGDSSLDFEVVYHVLSSDYTEYMNIQQEINLSLFEAFAKEDMGFAYPTRTLYLSKTGD